MPRPRLLPVSVHNVAVARIVDHARPIHVTARHVGRCGRSIDWRGCRIRRWCDVNRRPSDIGRWRRISGRHYVYRRRVRVFVVGVHGLGGGCRRGHWDRLLVNELRQLRTIQAILESSETGRIDRHRRSHECNDYAGHIISFEVLD
jgi:hypothetical protein